MSQPEVSDLPVAGGLIVRTGPRCAPAAGARFGIRIHAVQLAAWRAIAKARDLTVADMLREAVRQYATADEAAALLPPKPDPAELEELRRLMEARP